jgi:hypothetical protein
MSIPLTIESLAGGGAVERLHAAIQEALENALDPNRPATKPRKVKLEMVIKPSKNRTRAEVEITTSTTLCPQTPLETAILMDTDKHGIAVAAELIPGEAPGAQALPGMHPDGKITTFDKTRREA